MNTEAAPSQEESQAIEQPSKPRPYQAGNGEGILMFWFVILILASIGGGLYVASITIDIPRYPGVPGLSDIMDQVPIYGPIGGIAFALGGFCTASLFYALSKAIGLLKFIAGRVDR